MGNWKEIPKITVYSNETVLHPYDRNRILLKRSNKKSDSPN